MNKRDKKLVGSKYSSKWLETLDTITNIIIIPILVLSVICSIVMVNAKRNNSVPNIFGYSLVTILSGSMVNSGFEIDDTVLVKQTDGEDVEVGDIIAYYKYIETSKDIAQAVSMANKVNAEVDKVGQTDTLAYDYPTQSKVASWRLYLNKLFSNLTYTTTEASERAIRTNSTIIFHQVVEVQEYQNARWFKTWGTSNIDANGNPSYDGYWIKEDYVIGVYTNTSSVVRGFLGFAGTNTGIIWMVEVPSGIQLILSTLELIEIIDMMARIKRDQIRNGTYVDKTTYKKLLKERRQLVAMGNVDIDTLKKFTTPYENYQISYKDKDIRKSNININGPPTLNGTADANNNMYNDTGPDGISRDGPPWNNRDGTQSGRDGPPANGRDGPPNKRALSILSGRDGPPLNRGRTVVNGRDGPPANGRDGPPWNNRDGTSINGRNGPPGESPPGKSSSIKSLIGAMPKQIVNEQETELEIKNLEKLRHLLTNKSLKQLKNLGAKLGTNEVRLTERQISSFEDMYEWTDYYFVSKHKISKKGYIVEPDSKNEIFLVDKKTKNTYKLSSLGTIYSVHSGLIITDNGLFKVNITPDGVVFERININPDYKVVNAKQDIFGNICIGVTNGPQDEEVFYTSDGKRVSVWSRNALLALGSDKRLYFINMGGGYDLEKGTISDLLVINKDGSLVSVRPNTKRKTVFFEDGFAKYGFSWVNGNYLCLDNGYMFFNISTKQTYKLPQNYWQLSDSDLVTILNDGNLYKIKVEDYLSAVSQEIDVSLLQTKQLLLTKASPPKLVGNNLEFTSADSDKRFVALLDEEFLARANLRLGT